MTPQEKAFHLYFKYIREVIADKDKAKQCALIAVDIAIKCCKDYDELNETYVTQVDHWKEVKQEIEKL